MFYDSTLNPHNDRIERVVEDPDGNLIVGFSDAGRISIAKLNPDNGKIIWRQETNYNKHKSIIMMPDKSIIVSATGYTPVSGDTMGYGNIRSGVFKLSTHGDLLWNRVYGQQNNTFSKNPHTIYQNGHYYTVHTLILPGKSDSSNLLQLIQYNEQGHLVQITPFGSPAYNEGVYSFYPLSNGNFLILSYLYPSRNNQLEFNKLYQITPTGKVVYEKTNIAPDSSRYISNTSSIDKNDNILLSGYFYAPDKTYFFMDKIQPNLLSADSSTQTHTYDYLCDLPIIYDTIKIEPFVSYIYFDHTLGHPRDSFTNIALSVAEASAVNPWIKLYPNPAHDRIQIGNLQRQSLHIQVYSTDAKLVHQQHISSQEDNHSIDCSNWKTGIYFVHVWDENLHRKTHKLVKIE